ncbi:hypothetical protein [Streptomyces sp. NPDC020983]|uniref:hypothetical protein n=1 Tax=Streptomyces sp. NPDC020983 TaxID=3365106 RepID=UPI0037AF234B
MSLYGDEQRVFAHCRKAPGLISDGAARVIGSWWMDGPLGQSFASTGAVEAGLWDELTDRGRILGQVNDNHRLALEKLRDYLARHAGRGPVADWVEVWL